jgi:hypothetical protein
MKNARYILLLFACLVGWSQDTSQISTPPSNEEVMDLLNKTDEKLDSLQKALDGAKTILEKAQPGMYRQTSTLVSTGHTLIAAMHKNGFSAYALVALISDLDDIYINVAFSELHIYRLTADAAVNHQPSLNTSESFLEIAEEGKGLYDMSELLLHTTLRLVKTEEDIIHAAGDKK